MPPTLSASPTSAVSVARLAAASACGSSGCSLTDFRNYASLRSASAPSPSCSPGPTAPARPTCSKPSRCSTAGQGLRRAPYPELARVGDGRLGGGRAPAHATWPGRHRHRARQRGASARAAAASCASTARTSRAPARWPSHVEIVWLTPAMDGLFTGPGSERRRFLDRLIPCFDPGYRPARSGSSSAPCSSATGCWPTTCATPRASTASSASWPRRAWPLPPPRAAAVAELAAAIGRAGAMPRRQRRSPGPSSRSSGTLETDLRRSPPSTSRTPTCARCAAGRERDRAAGPHAGRAASLRPGRRATAPRRCRPRSAPPASRRRC